MTSEEVKELLRQLAKDTQEVGDIRSRTVRIRLDGDEQEPETAQSGPDKRIDDAEADYVGGTDADYAADAPEEMPEEAEGEAPKEKKAPKVKKASKEGKAPKEGKASGGMRSRLKRAFRKKEEPEDAPEKDRKRAAKAPEEKYAQEEHVQEEPEETSLPQPEDDGEEEPVTRYMDDAETKAYLKEKAGSSANGAKGTKKKGNTLLAAFLERQRNTPVEPDEFDSDAWMFRSDGKAPGARQAHRPEPESAAVPDEGAEEEAVPVRKKAGRLADLLGGRGFGFREMAILGIVIVLAIVIIAAILTLISNKRKGERVQAEEGLQVVVEKEPSKWCKSGEVTMSVSAVSPIQSISVNSQPATLSGQGRTLITAEVDRSPAEVVVVCEDKVRTATVGFARIDTEDPVISVSSDEEGLVTLNAQDAASGVDEIWYGTVSGLSDVPAYQKYEGPFEPEKGKLYSYFAKDKAGNTSVPVTTNLTPASAIDLGREEVSMFPGETYAMQLATDPDKAFLNGLVWSSSDESVAKVEADGTVTAFTDGQTVITASADGVESASCTVHVRSEVSVTISAVGDMTLGEDVSFSTLNNFTTVYTMKGPEYFLQNVKDIFEADDITFANLEGTLTDQGSRQVKEYAFRGDPSYVQVLTSGSVEAVTLANNHSYDYGDVSHTDTQKYLDEAGVEWCEGDKIIVKDVNGVRMALIGIYVLAEGAAKADQVVSCIAQAKEAGAQLIVVAFHWGTERETSPDVTQRTLAHLAVDEGADLVVGHHPHVLQGIEKYAGKYICYSLGNFCFGGNSNPSDKDTMIFQQTFRILRGGTVDDGGVSVIPCSVSSVGDWNNYQPTPATGAEAERIMEKINDLCTAFGTSF